MPVLQFYTRKDCGLCHSAFAVVQRLQRRFRFRVECIDIDDKPDLTARFGTVIPVLAAKNQEFARSFFDEKTLAGAIEKWLRTQP